MKSIRILLTTLAVGLLLGAGLAQERGGTLVGAWAQNPVGLDPHATSAYSSYQVLGNVLDTLVDFDDVPAHCTHTDPELVVGTVDSVTQRERGLFQKARLKPSVDYSRIEEVFVITGTK